MCRSLAEGGRRCPHADQHHLQRAQSRSKADNNARKQISRYKQQVAKLEADTGLRRVLRAQMATTDPADSGIIQRLRADRSRARRAGDAAAVETVEAQLVAAQLVLAEHRLTTARAVTEAATSTPAPAGMERPTPATEPTSEPAVRFPGLTPAAPGREDEVLQALRAAGASMRAGDWQRMADLRAALPADMTRDEVNAMLKRMSKNREINLAPDPDRKSLQQDDRDSAIRVAGEENHLLVWEPRDPVGAVQRIADRGLTAVSDEDLKAAQYSAGSTPELNDAIYHEQKVRRGEAAR